MIVYIFEGKTIYGDDIATQGLYYDHSLSLHKTFEGAEAQLKLEANILMDNGFALGIHDILDKSGEKHIRCTLTSCLAEKRILEVSAWTIRE